MSNTLSQAEIDALMGGGGNTASSSDGGGTAMSQAEIDALMGGGSTASSDSGTAMSQAEIDALMGGGSTASSDGGGAMSQAEIDALMGGGSSAPEPAESFDFSDAVAAPGAAMSQADIDALMSASPVPSPAMNDEEEHVEELLSSTERDVLGEIGNISMGSAATTLFTMLNHRVTITTPRVRTTTMRAIAKQYPMPFVAVEVQYTKGLSGTNILFLRELDVKIITDLLMGGDGSNTSGELSEMHLSAISEVMNQMVGASSTSLAKFVNVQMIDISPPKAFRVDMNSPDAYPLLDPNEPIIRSSFDMEVEGLINSEIMQVMPIEFGKRMVSNLLAESTMSTPAAPQQAQQAPPPPPQYQAPPQQAAQAPPQYQAPPQQAAPVPPPQYQAPPPYPAEQYQQQPPQAPPYPGMPPYQGYPPYPGMPPYQGYPPYPQYPGPYPEQPPVARKKEQNQSMVDVRPMNYNSFDDTDQDGFMTGDGMDLLMDVPLSVSVELGKSTKYIKEILDFNVGTIVVLDKMAGELVDIVVNGKLIAKGEVVVIDDNYGARITDIVSPSKRINQGK